MSKRWLLTAVGLAVVLLSCLFLWQGLDRSDKFGSIVAAITGVVALGVSLLSATQPTDRSSSAPELRVTGTGSVKRRSGRGTLNTGFWGPTGRKGVVVISDTGSIEDGGGEGDVNTGVRR